MKSLKNQKVANQVRPGQFNRSKNAGPPLRRSGFCEPRWRWLRMGRRTSRRLSLPGCAWKAAFLASLTLLLASAGMAPAGAFKVLVFSKTTGYRHDSITNGLAAIRQMGTNNNFDVVATENAADFTATNLAGFRSVIFLSTSGEVLDDAQQTAFQGYIESGGGFVGIHAASDTEYSWPWYAGLIGAHFSSHPAIQRATVLTEERSHPSTCFLPDGWVRNDEWYNFDVNPRPNVNVLCRLDESTYTGGTMGDHPIAWFHDYDGGRAWYTAGGHTPESFAEPLFRSHLLGGIQYAAGSITKPPAGALVLFDGRDASHWRSVSTGLGVPWQVTNGILTVVPGTGNIRTEQVFEDYLLHVAFSIPPTAPGTAEGSLGNSGIYLDESYEIQIMDSFGRPIAGANETGSIYGQRDPSTNAALPAGTWESFDIDYRTPRWNGLTKTSHARVSVWWNGVLVQNDIAIPTPTGAGQPETPLPGPVVLQDLVGPVQFRNIWLLPRDIAPRGRPRDLVLPGSLWRYLDDGSAPAIAWRSTNFSDVSWSLGRAQLGYGDGDEATVIRSDRPDTTRIITTYFRRNFVVTNATACSNLELRLLRDDGAAVYLNGTEVFRNNLPGGSLDSTTTAITAISGDAELQWISTNLNSALLREGTNLLAVEIHQSSTASSDVSFDLALSAIEFPPPDLTVARAGQGMTLAWPALPTGFQLERASVLASNQWTAVTNAVFSVTNVRATITLPSPGIGQAFYRLRKN